MFSFSDTLTLIAMAGNFLLGIIVFLKGIKNKLNVAFATFSFVTVIWILTNYIFSFINSSFILHSQYALGSIILPVSLVWIYILIDKRIELKKMLELLVISVSCFAIAYLDPLFISVVEQNGSTVIILGPLFYFYSLFILGILGLVTYTLILGIKKANSVKKTQIRFVLFGVIAFAGISILLDFILPFFNIIPVGSYDAQSSLLFVALSAYAIIRHKLFDLKIIATELVTFGLWIFILIRALISTDVRGTLVELGLLLVMIIFGILLIKSVNKEVSQREKIELLAADLQKANERLTELDRQKSEFVSFATHQLRAPLTAMKGYASMILEGDMGAVAPETRTAVSRIYDSSNTLAKIVDDYLNIARIELGAMKYAFETVDLKQLIEDVIGEIKPNIDKSNLKFSFTAENINEDYHITADRDKLKQVIANLIDNSIKYTPQGSVDVTLSFDRKNHKFRFMIKDTGIGIASDVLPRLFQKFTRAGNANKANIRGSGLGLFVAKEIINAHHAVIRAESAGEGKGSAFIVEFDPLSEM